MTQKEIEVGEDPDLIPAEKEVTLTTTKDQDFFYIYSDVASVTKYLLRHPAVEITSRRERDGEVVGVTGHLPRSLLNFKAEPRNTNQFGRMLSSATLRDKNSKSEHE